MGYWAEPRVRREQALMFPPRLEDAIDEHHPARLLDEILQTLDWSAWEAEYDGTRGQPPIHPRIVAGVLLYGMMRGVRSSRKLEYFCGHNIDYLWLVRLVEVTFDGTRVKANAGRFQTWTAEKVAAALKELEALFEEAMDETEREQMHQRLSSAEGKATYGRRFHAAESPFAYLKGVMGVRQFLLRGLEKVRTEWLWVCTAYNLRKLLSAVGKLRAALTSLMAAAVS